MESLEFISYFLPLLVAPLILPAILSGPLQIKYLHRPSNDRYTFFFFFPLSFSLEPETFRVNQS